MVSLQKRQSLTPEKLKAANETNMTAFCLQDFVVAGTEKTPEKIFRPCDTKTLH